MVFVAETDMAGAAHVCSPSAALRLWEGGSRGKPAVSPCSYSHSIVAGGFEERSSATRFTAGISFTIRLEIVSSTS